jgi:hypothetical protein
VAKVSAEGEEIDVVPGFVAPSVMSLDVVAVMIPIYMKPDALIILTGHRSAIYIERDLLINTMSESSSGPESAMLTIPSSKKICVDV